MTTMLISRLLKALAVLPLVVILPIVFLLASPASTRAQGLGRISGTVTDTTGAAIANAEVVAIQAGTGVSTPVKSNGDGAFVFPSLPPAGYSLTATMPGFKKFEQKGVILQADGAATVNIVLAVGATGETVNVTADAQQVDVTTGTIQQVVDQRRINDLPLNGRNAAALTRLVAGVVAAPSGASDQGITKTFPGVVNVSVNGTRANQTNYLLDGGNNLDEYTNVNAPFPFPDALQEFSVQTSNYAAEYGQNAGGVVNIITKSGTSQYHGDVFEYVRNAIFNAHNYFNPIVDPLKRNQFGGTLGGPVGIPGLWSTRKAFFFGAYQRTILRTQAASTSSTPLPTTDNLAGKFTFTAANPTLIPSNCVKDPATNTCYPYTNTSGTTYTSQVPTTQFDPASLALLKYIPVGNGTSVSIFRKPTAQQFDEGTGRFDQELSPRDRYTLRYFVDKFHNAGVLNLKNLTTYSDQSDITYQNALLSETHIFSDSLINNFILSYQREGSVRGPLAGSISATDLGVNIWQPAFKQIQSISVAGYFSIGDNPHATFDRSNYTLSDDLHWQKGSHTFSAGFHGEIGRIDVTNQFQQPGTFSFNATTTNNAMASFFLGYLYEFKQSSGQYQNNRTKFFGGYLQDSWKANRRLTLNYGLRYEPFIPMHEKFHRVGQFNPAGYAAGIKSTQYPNAPAGLFFVGDPGVPTDGVRPVYKNFMPRVGFAWDAFGTGKTSVRGGGGLFYDTRTNGLFNNAWIGSTPFSTSVDLIQGGGTFSNPYGSNANPFPAAFPPAKDTQFLLPFAVITFDPSGNYQVPLTYSYNLGIEQQLAENFTASIAYVGVRASHVFTSPELNPAVYIPGSNLSTNARRIYKNYTTISETNMGGNSGFNSLQVTLNRRFAHGFSGTFNYTWSKSLDNVPTGAAVTSAGAGQSYVLPVYMPDYKRLDEGLSDFDHRNVITASYVWQLPTITSTPLLVRALVNGWQTTGLLSYQSGSPLTVMAGKDISMTGINRDVPNLIGNPYGRTACGTVAYCVSYLDPAAFANPATGQFGTLRKGSLVGPGYADWDAGIFRSLNFTERWRLQFRAEYFNVLNHTNFSSPGLSKASSSFGRITAASDPRIAQLSLKMSF